MEGCNFFYINSVAKMDCVRWVRDICGSRGLGIGGCRNGIPRLRVSKTSEIP